MTISINLYVASGRKNQKYRLILDHIHNSQLFVKISVLLLNGYLRMKKLKMVPILGILSKKQKIFMPTAWIPILSMPWAMNNSKQKLLSHGLQWDEHKMDNLPIRNRFYPRKNDSSLRNFIKASLRIRCLISFKNRIKEHYWLSDHIWYQLCLLCWSRFRQWRFKQLDYWFGSSTAWNESIILCYH